MLLFTRTISFALVLALMSCKKSKSSDEPTPSNGSNSGAQLAFTLAVAQTDSKFALTTSNNRSTSATMLPAFSSVPATGSNLKSLKLHIDEIQMCQDVVLNGTAVSQTKGCITIFKGKSNNRLGNTSDIKDALTAAAESDEGFIDLMNQESLKTLNQQIALTQDNIGSYRYSIISIPGPIKVKAVMIDPTDGVTPVLYSKGTSPGTCIMNNQPGYACAVATSTMTSGPEEEAVFNGIGGGSFITKFQQPFDITEADISNQQAYALTLAFNPDSLVQGVTSPGATNFPPMTDNTLRDNYNLGNTMALVSPQFAGIFFKKTTSNESPKIIRETYLGTYTLPNNNGTARLRIEFYSVSSDPKRNIYGVSTATIPTENTKTYLIGWQRVYGISSNTDGSINLLDYQGNKVLSNFKRISSINESTTGELRCDTVGFDCDAGSTFSQTFTLSSLGNL